MCGADWQWRCELRSEMKHRRAYDGALATVHRQIDAEHPTKLILSFSFSFLIQASRSSKIPRQTMTLFIFEVRWVCSRTVCTLNALQLARRHFRHLNRQFLLRSLHPFFWNSCAYASMLNAQALYECVVGHSHHTDCVLLCSIYVHCIST